MVEFYPFTFISTLQSTLFATGITEDIFRFSLLSSYTSKIDENNKVNLM